MSNARQGRSAAQGKANSLCKAEHMRNQGTDKTRLLRRADARGKAGKMLEAKQGRCARQVRSDARGKTCRMSD
jgi:hypothetical protein